MPVTPEDVDRLLAEEEPLPAANRQPVTPEMVDQLLEQADADDDARLKDAFRQSLEGAPEKKASVLALSRNLGLSPYAVEQNHDELAKTWEVAQHDPAAWRKANPKLAQMVLERPHLGPVVMKDEQLSLFSRAINAYVDYAHKLDEAIEPITSKLSPDQYTPEAKAKRSQELESIRVTPRKVEVTTDERSKAMDSLTEEYGEAARLVGIPVNRYREAAAHMELGQLQFNLMAARRTGGDTYELEKEILEKKRLAYRRDLNESPGEQVLSDIAEGAASNVAVLKDMGLGAGAGAVIGGVVGGAAGGLVTGGPGIQPGAVAGAKAGARAGAKFGAAVGSFRLEAGNMYGQLLEAKTPDGQPLSEEQAMGGALLYGAVAAGVEVASMDAMMKATGLGKVFTTGASREALQELLANRTFREIAQRVGKAWLTGTGAEMSEEFVQSLWEDAVGGLAMQDATGEFHLPSGEDVKASVGKGLREAEKAGVGSGLSLGTFEAASSMVGQAVQKGMAEQAGQQVAAITGVLDSPTSVAAPDAVAKLIAEETAKSGHAVTDLYVDPAAFTKYFQDQNTDPAAAAEQLLGEQGANQLQEAMATGGKLRVPITAYLERWGGSEAAQALQGDTTTRSDFDTANQLAEKAKLEEAENKAVEELAAKFDKEGIEPQTPAETKFLEAMEKQLSATGTVSKKDARTQLQLLRALIRTAPERFGLGKTADELFQHFALAIGNTTEPLAMGTGVLAQEPNAGSLDTLRSEFEKMPREHQVRALLLDRNTGLLNARAFRALPRDPARPYLAEFDLEGKKMFNDAHGHESVDGALRLMGAALKAQGVTDAVATGGAVKAWVRDQAHAEELAAALEQAVGDGVRVTAGVTEGKTSLDETFEEAAKAHTETKAKERFRKRLGERKGWPLAFAPGQEADIDWREEGNKKRLSLKSPEFKALMAEAAKKAEPTAQRFKGAPAVDRFAENFDAGALSDDLREWADNLDADWFDVVSRDETGMLTDDGFAIARQLAPKKFVVSADMRGLKGLNDAFGKSGADVVIAAFKRLIIANGGAKFDAAHPHGDEFFFQGDDHEDLEDFLGALQDAASKHFFVQRRPGGGGVLHVGVHFVHGIGSDLDHADRVALPAAKEKQGDVPGSVELGRAELEREVRRLEVDGGRRTDLGPQRSDRPQGVRVRTGAEPAGGVPEGVRGEEGGESRSEVQEVAPEDLAELRATIARMQKRRRKLATEFLEYVLDPESHSRPVDMEPALEKWFFEDHHLYDPLRGPPEVDLRTGRVVFGGRKVKKSDTSNRKKRGGGGRQSGELLKAKLQRNMSPSEFMALGYKVFKQDPGSAADARGYTAIAQKGLMRIFRVALNKDADLSTFLHESAHVFLEMFGDLAAREDAPDQVKADYAATLKWMGIADRKELGRDHHEKWARGFEAYLMEGKAPSVALAGAFERFKLWLKSIYRSIASLNVELSDDVRGVFDRLLATDREIELMKRRMGISAQLFTSPEQMSQVLGRDVDPKEWQAYLEEYQAAHSHAARALELRVMKDRLRENQSWWKEELARQKDVAGVEYEGLPARMAQQFLRGKGMAGTEAEGAIIHLDRAAVEAAVGPENARKFPLRKKGGTHPGDIAGFFGFATGDEMLAAIVQLAEKDVWVKERAEQVMREKFPELLQERAELEAAVAKGLHGDQTVAWLMRELRALGSKANLDQVKRAAKRIADGRQVGRLDAGAILKQERAAANEAMRAAAKGDLARAASLKLQQLVNMMLHRELTAAREEREDLLELAGELAKPKSRARLGKASPLYRDGVDLLLETFALKAPLDRDGELPSVQEVVGAMELDGATVMFDGELLAKLVSKPRSWKELKVAEMRELHAALKNIRGAARAKAGVLLDGRRVEKEQVMEQLLAEAAAVLEHKGPATTQEAQTLKEKAERVASSVDGWMTRIETLVGYLVEDDLKSTWFKAIILPLQEAKHREVDLLEKVVQPIVEAFDQVPKEIRERFMEPVDGAKLFPHHRTDLTPPRRRFELLMMALNAGNEGNLQRLLDGRGITERELGVALSLLTKEEMDWVQSILDASERKVQLAGETEPKSLKERAFDVEERDSGVRPVAVKARAITTTQGTWRGGYFPAVYHSEVETVGKKQEAQALAELLDPSFVRPGTPHGHLKKRADKFNGAISLSPGTIYSHLARAVHDVAFREALKSVGSLVLAPEIQEALRARLGPEKAKLFLPWLKDVGTMRSGMDWGGLNAITQWLRSNMAPALLGWRPSIPAGDAANLAVVALDLDKGTYAGALKDFGADIPGMTAWAMEKSGELRTRHSQLTREFAQAVKELTGVGPLKRGPLAFYKKHAFVFMEWSDRLTSTPAWIAAYRQAVGEGKAELEAVRTADKFVRDRFPSHSAVDMAHILRDKGFWGMITVFGGYSNVLFNLQRRAVQPWLRANGMERLKLTGKTVGALLALWSVGNVLPAVLMGHGPEKDEEWWKWYLRRLAMAPFENFHSEAGGTVGSVLTGKRPNPRGSPISGYLETLGGSVLKMADGDADARKQVKALVQTIGLTTGLPITPVNNTIDVLFSEHPDAVDVAHDAYVGDR